MIIGSNLENQEIEKRIAITPEIIKKYISLGFEINLINNYGAHIGFQDSNYEKLGAKIIFDEKDLINNSDIIIQIQLQNDNYLYLIKENKTVEENIPENMDNNENHNKN